MAKTQKQKLVSKPPSTPESPLVTLITPTGGRPKAFTFCQQMMMRQTYKGPIQWIVIYDTPEEIEIIVPTDSNIKVEVHRGPKDYRPNINTQRPNLNHALQFVKGSVVVLPEDDDNYQPKFLQTILGFLNNYEIAGEACSTYYNLKERCYKEWNNTKHASLCQTGILTKRLDILDEAINSGELFMDIALWRSALKHKLSSIMFMLDSPCVVGMKGIERFGIGAGHKPEGFIRDPGFEKLVELVGKEDAETYRQMIGATQPIATPPITITPTTPIAKVIAKVEERLAVKRIVAMPTMSVVNTEDNNPFIKHLTSDSYGKIRGN